MKITFCSRHQTPDDTCEQCKPTEVSESALSDLLCWTGEAPLENGYYWLQAHKGEDPVIVQVFSFIGKKRFSFGGDTVGVGVEMVSSKAKWAGPIRCPHEI